MRPPEQNRCGFTRLELAAAIGGLALLGMVVLPALATSKGDAERAVCGNNLRQLGRGVQSWAGDHGGQPPWWVFLAQGGTRYTQKNANAWFEFYSLTNHISPRLLTCPGDAAFDLSVSTAADWAAFLLLRQNSVSYNIGAHAGYYDWDTRMILATDRNLRFDALNYQCAAGFNNAATVVAVNPTSVVAWTNSSHASAGNLLFFDGAVEFTSTPRLRELILRPGAEPSGQEHFIRAR